MRFDCPKCKHRPHNQGECVRCTCDYQSKSEEIRNVIVAGVRIFVRGKSGVHADPEGEFTEITDLYWFEENGVHNFDEKDSRFEFQFIIAS